APVHEQKNDAARRRRKMSGARSQGAQRFSLGTGGCRAADCAVSRHGEPGKNPFVHEQAVKSDRSEAASGARQKIAAGDRGFEMRSGGAVHSKTAFAPFGRETPRLS